jgi:methanogenic corrinoid protein MtbC1
MTMVDEDEIILSDLDDDELVQQMHDDLYDGLQDEIVEGVKILLERKWTPYDVLTKALVEGMTIVCSRSINGGKCDEIWHGNSATTIG